MSGYEHGAALQRKLETDLARMNATKEAIEQQIRDLSESCRQMLAREQRIRARIHDTLTNAAKRQEQIVARAQCTAEETTTAAAHAAFDLLTQARNEASEIIAHAHQQATSIITAAESRAGHIQERAYEQGRALADRQYSGMHNPGRSRRNDDARARRTVLGSGVSR